MINVHDSKEEINDKSHSFFNRAEADIASEIVVKIYRHYLAKKSQDLEKFASIGIITPYSAQVEKIRKRLKKAKKVLKTEFDLKHLKLLTVATVDGFQGLEKDFIILSLVRSKGDSVGFINCFKRLNVAITRAKHGLVILGDVEHIRNNAKNQDFRDLINFYRAKKSLIQVENMQALYNDWFVDHPDDVSLSKNMNTGENISSDGETEEGEVKIDLDMYGRNLSNRKLREFKQRQEEMVQGKGGGYGNQEKLDFSKIVIKKLAKEGVDSKDSKVDKKAKVEKKVVKKVNRLAALLFKK